MHGDVMVIPTEGDQVVGVRSAPLRPGDDMVYLESVPGIISFHRATTIAFEDVVSQFGWDRSLFASQIQRFARLSDSYDLDLAVTKDLLQCPGPDARTS
jgi:hypothetical protein